MPKKPFFSFVIPTFNRAEDLRFALYCILRQTFSDFEIVVSDNCSEDNTLDIVESFKSKKIRYFKNKTNIGVLPNVKKSISYAEGEYVFLHSDDDFLLYESSLRDIYENIKKNKPGYLRVNYITRTPDKKRLFRYHGNTPSKNNNKLAANVSSDKVLSFILTTDPGFITGLVFKNNLPKDVNVIDSDPFWVIKILFYTTKKWGGYFVAKPHLIASWSTWRVNKNNFNQIYSIIDGKLHSEPYFNFIKARLNKTSYEYFLHRQLMEIYILRFPAIKYYTGSNNTMLLSKRIRKLDGTFDSSLYFWIYYGLALILPRVALRFIKDVAFYKYSRFSKTKDDKGASRDLKKLEGEYLHDKVNN